VETSLHLAADLARIQDTFDRAVTSANEITKSVDVVMDAFDTLGDLGVSGIVQLIISGKIKKVEDVGQLLQVAKRVPSLFKDIQAVIPTIQSLAQDVQSRAPNFGEILDSSWESESAPVKEAIGKIQASIRKNLLDKVEAIIAKSKQVQDLVNGLTNRGVDVTLDVKVASYQRWSDISLDLPCSRTGQKEYSLAGYKTSFDYPEFYSCPYSNRIPFPNHHIPYIKLQLKSNKRSLPEPSTVNSSAPLVSDPFPWSTAPLPPTPGTQRPRFELLLVCTVATTCLVFAMFQFTKRRVFTGKDDYAQREERERYVLSRSSDRLVLTLRTR
jgi:hypothetical protein